MNPHADDLKFTLRDATKDRNSWRELVYHPINAPPICYILEAPGCTLDLVQWAEAFIEQDARYPDFVTTLSSKMAEEQEEFIKAVDAYSALAEKGAVKHDLNTAWLHVLDEAADPLNTALAAYIVERECKGVLEVPDAVFFDAVEEEVDCIADLVANINEGQLASLGRAVVSFATAKLRMTELRPHAQSGS